MQLSALGAALGGKVDLVAATSAAAATCVCFTLLKRILLPFPPTIPVVPLEKRGILPFLMQHAWFFQFDLNALSVSLRALELFADGVCGIRVFHLHRYYVLNALDAEHILTRPEQFIKGEQYRMLLPTIGRGLLTLVDDGEHAAHRRIASPAFSSDALRLIARSTMVDHSHRLVRAIGQAAGSAADGRVQLRELIHRTAFAIICEAAFRTDRETADQIAMSFNELMSAPFPLELIVFRFLERLPFRRYQLRAQLRAKIRAFTATLVEKAATEYEGLTAEERRAVVDSGRGKALLDYFVLDAALDPASISEHALTFLFAGHETSSNTLQWALALLATHPEVQRDLLEELRDAFPRGSAPSPEDLAADRCPLLDAVLRETLRLFPVAAVVSRTPVSDTVLPASRAFVPADATLLVNIFAIHRNPKLYGPDAHEFVPSRWIGGDLAERAGACGFMPFSVGKRNCIGRDFAMLEMRLVLAMIISEFALGWPKGQTFPRRRMGITLSPRDAWFVTVHPRTEDANDD